MARKQALLGKEPQKIHPKLRMIANGNSEVNAVRAERSSVISCTPNLAKKFPFKLGIEVAPVARKEVPRTVTRGSLSTLPRDVLANVFIHLLPDAERPQALPGQTARKANLVTATVPLKQLPAIARLPGVTFVEPGEPLTNPTPAVSNDKVAAPSPDLRKVGGENHHKYGEGVLIGIIDVQGFDFAHPDFLDERRKTRFVRIWDQGANVRPHPSGFDYGAEFLQDQLNAAIEAAPRLGVPPQEIERQSEMEVGSHGTHVASIAAGNHGICRKAVIAGVLMSLPKDDLDRRKSFYDSTRLAHAVDYLLALGQELGLPVSINVSLGTNGHAHDGSSAINRWVDASLTLPGRSLCVAAGNAGQEKPENEQDFGYIMGRIHTSGSIPAPGLATDIEWLVLGNRVVDVSENELEVWYSAQDRFAVSVRPPNGHWIGPIEPREFIENRQLSDGSFLSIYNELYHPSNGCNWISIYLSPMFSEDAVVGVPSGRWVLRLHGLDIRDGRYHGWIERDDPGSPDPNHPALWFLPSIFSERSNIDDSSVSTLACGHNIISVANLHSSGERINITSSQGPTRDGRPKPEVAAPGTDIVAAKGFAGSDDLWIQMSGTSMASPYVAGVVGLMLAVEGKLTAAQIGGIIHRTARPLPGGTYHWVNDAGFGSIDPVACLEEARLAQERTDRT